MAFANMNPHLCKAAAKGEIEPFNKIAKDELGSMVTHNKNTVLHVHIESHTQKSLNFVKHILEMCPSLLVQVNAKGDAPIHVGARCGHPAVVEVLIEFAKTQPKELESNVEAARQMLEMTNEEKNTGLHVAVQHRSLDVVKKLIEADPDVPYSTNHQGETPLYIAATKGYVEILAEILNNCPSAATEDPNGKTALHAVVNSKKKKDVIELLLQKKSSLCREKDQHGWTPLHQAAYFGKRSITSMLLKYDELLRSEASSARTVDKDRKMTALHLAASQGYTWTVIEIIRFYPECCDLVDDRKWNVLHFAMASLHPTQLKALLDSYPKLINLINEKDEKGNTPLHVYAALWWNCSSYEVVPRNGEADYHAVNDQNISVAHILHYGYTELKKEILKLSKDVGQGQYPHGVVRMAKDKMKTFYWIYMDDEVFGTKNAKDSHLVVAALIATVTFAAAFTLPGGYKSEDSPNQGTAILSKTTAFQAFVISNGMALVLSLFAVFVHFIMSLKAFQRIVFLFVFALCFTIIAMFAMVIAFVTGTYAVLSPSLGLAVPTCIVGLSFFFLVFFMSYKLYQKHTNRKSRRAKI